MSADALIVGAGIVGAACAAELAALGMRVDVLDAQGIGGGATAAGMGHIVVMNDSPAEFALSRYSRELVARNLRRSCARAMRSRAAARSGSPRTTRNGRPPARCTPRSTRKGSRREMLDAAALRAGEPALAESMAGGLRIEHDSIVYAPTVAEWLLTQSPHAANIRVRLGTRGGLRSMPTASR